MRNIIILTLITFFSILQADAQLLNQANSLRNGDQLPDLKMIYKKDNENKILSLESLKGKLVIFDFWNIWCTSCISAMPDMAKLQEKFQDKLQIILVTNNTQEQIDKQFRLIQQRSKNPSTLFGVPSSLISLVGDTLLHKLFPHVGVPHHVWIDQHGRVKFIAGGYDTNEATITSALNGVDINIAEKVDKGDFDFSTPIYLEGKGRQLNKLRAYSLLYKEASEYPNPRTVEEIDTANNSYRLRCYNFTLMSLFQKTTVAKFGKTFSFDNRILLTVKDRDKFFWPVDKSKIGFWRKENLYCYEQSLPLWNKNNASDMMLSDLNKYLPYQAAIEMRKIKCLALILRNKVRSKKSDTPNTEALGTEFKTVYEMSNESIDYFVNTGLSTLNRTLSTPVINTTGYIGKMNIKLSSRTDLKIIVQELRAQNLDLVETEMEIEMLVIKDRN